MEWTTLVWIALAAFMVFNTARGRRILCNAWLPGLPVPQPARN
jgi:hypothetical protein